MHQNHDGEAEPSPYPFKPHCTVVDLGRSPDPEALSAIQNFAIPDERLLITGISVESLTDFGNRTLHFAAFGRD